VPVIETIAKAMRPAILELIALEQSVSIEATE